MIPAPAPSARPAGRLPRRQVLVCLIGVGAAVALPLPASATTVSSYGRGYQTGGYR
ncbi:hypothetical protein [uncultured Friedmanniella sp.]|uniref:hypothetical protein n=1 Tax=uncultured Friedmanniella sp. TaxID=335381 RepID=UPI0035C997B1